jgi:hypothetical protein
MVPGGCILKHPRALPPPPDQVPYSFTNQKESEEPQKFLQWFFWMHNARGSFNCVDEKSNFLRKNSTYIVHKQDLSNEVHSFFKQIDLMWKENPKENIYQQNFVSILFFGCCLLVII